MSSKDASLPVKLSDTDTSEVEQPASAPVIVPLVSVAITSYNSARWLPRALDSVLEQQVDFPIEIVIGDDCSQDETVQVANEYQRKHPDLVRVIARPVNIGIQRNYYETFESCKGKYIAWLDADDYWTDPKKLAKQISALEEDPTISTCCHYVRWVTPEGQVKKEKWPYLTPGRHGLEAVLHANFIGTASVIFRNGIHRDLPPWYFDIAPLTDWPIWVLSALAGDILLLDEVMANYVHTPGSAFTSKGTMFLWNMEIRFYDCVESMLPFKWRRFVRNEKGRRYEAIAYWVRKEGNFSESRQAAVKAFRAPFLVDRLGSKSKSLLAAVVREAQWKLSGGRQAKS